MKKIDGSVTTQNEDFETENALFTYSEDEKQLKEINAANAKLLFTPEFIPYYPDIKKKYNFSHLTTLVYGFIRYYKANASSRFYFTNEQLAEMFGCSIRSITNCISELKNAGLIETSAKIKAGGGQIRFVDRIFRLEKNFHSDSQKTASRNEATTSRKLLGNKNTVKENSKNGNTHSASSLDTLLKRRQLRKAKKVNKYGYTPFSGDAKQFIPIAEGIPLSQQEVYEIARDCSIATMEVKRVMNEVLNSVKIGNAEKYKIESVRKTTELWCRNGIAKSEIPVLTSDVDRQMYIEDWSPEGIEKRVAANKRLVEMGVWDEKEYQTNTEPLLELL